MTDELALRVEAIYLRAALAVAERDQLDAATRLRERLAGMRVPTSGGPMARLAARLELSAAQIDFLWAAVAAAVEPRLSVHLESLGGPSARRGLSVATYQRIVDLDAGAGRALALWLAAPNPLVDAGLLLPSSEPATPAMRAFAAPVRLCAHLAGDDAPDPPLRNVAAPAALVLDDEQEGLLASLTRVLVGPARALVVIEAAPGSGRTSAIAHAAGRPLVVLRAAGLAGPALADALLALRREHALTEAVPVIVDADRLADGGDRLLAAHADGFPGTLVIVGAVRLDTTRSVVRARWPVPAPPARRRLWDLLASSPAGDVDGLAQRYAVGAGAMRRAVSTARLLGEGVLDDVALSAGLRHNIAEELGELAVRVDVTQTWDDLVLADDTHAQIDALVARVRHAHQVLERWRYRGKMARGTGVPALFSGPPGTGKTMVAGLIARELDLELYQVDLSQVVSKWVGETEKQLARVFDAAEQGHGLLLFDEADALFGQRTADVKGAVDRYANLEVNYLLQRVEAFGGITILTTNLDTAIDRALKRRLAAHIVFELPEEEERAALWRRMMTTSAAPLAADIDADELARAFPKMSGANIRNAALSAAFLAAADGAGRIDHEHLIRAARSEYRSMGHVLAARRDAR